MPEIYVDIKTNASLQAFAAMDAATQASILKLKSLELATKQAEAASAAYGNSIAASNERIARSALAAERAQRSVSASYTRSVDLRHGSGLALDQATRQITHQIFASGQDPSKISEYARAVFDGAQKISAARKLLADDLRFTRRADKFFEAPRVGWESAGLGKEAWRAEHESMIARMGDEAAPFLAGEQAIDLINRGGRIRGDDFWTRRARKRIAKRAKESPDVQDRLTKEAFDEEASTLGGEMKQTAALALRGVTATVGAAVTAAYAAYSIGESDRTRWDAAADRQVQAAPGRRSLRQVADSAADYRGMLKSGEELQSSTGMSADEANQTIFSLKSTGEFDATGIAVAKDSFNLGMPAADVLTAIQKLKVNMGGSAGTSPELLEKLLISAEPSPANIPDIARGIGTLSQSWRSMGGQGEQGVDESLAVLSALSIGAASTDEGATAAKNLLVQMTKRKGRILWGDQAPPTSVLEQIRSLPRLSAENRLMNEKGQPVSPEVFLEEMRAVEGYHQVLNNPALIDDQLVKLRSANGSTNSPQASYGDLASDSARAAEGAKRDRETVENHLYGPAASLSHGMFDKAFSKSEGEDNPFMRVMREGLNKLDTNPVVGSGYVNFADRMVSEGQWGSEDLLKQWFRMKNQDKNIGDLQNMLKDDSPTMPGRLINPTYDETGDPIAGSGTPGPMTEAEKRVDKEELRNLIQEKANPTAASAPKKMAPSPYDALQTSLINRRQIMGEDRIAQLPAWERGFMGSFDQMVSDYYLSTGATPDKAESKILEDVVGQKRREAAIGAETMIKGGARPEQAQAYAMEQLAAVPGLFDQKKYKHDTQIIDDAIAAAQKDFNAASIPEDKQVKSKRLAGLQAMNNSYYADDGVRDYAEAAAGAAQITGDKGDPVSGAINTVGKMIGDKLDTIVQRLPAVAEDAKPGAGGPAYGPPRPTISNLTNNAPVSMPAN